MTVTCHACGGSGIIILKDSRGNEIKAQRCPVCDGEGCVCEREPSPWIPYPPYRDPYPYRPYPSCPEWIWTSDDQNTITITY